MPTISGTVLDDTGTPVAGRIVRAYRRDTGALLAETQTSAGEAGDSDFSSVSLLLHMDGTNGSTTFTDNSPTPKTVTAVGNAQISTAQSKFGGASALFDGSGDYLSIPHSADFDFVSGDFTIELWVNLSTLSGGHHLLGKYQTTSASPFAIYQDAANVGFYASGNGTSWNLVSDLRFGTALSSGVWYHFAVTRDVNLYRTFRDGVLISSVSASGALVSNTQNVQVGRGANASPTEFHGYLDDLRITKGVARYTANFTPPTAPFPNSATPLALGEYQITTAHTGECNVVCLDDAAGTVYNDLILRTTPV